MASRHREIVSLINSRGFVSIGQMAKSFKVSEQTVRRDLKDLSHRGLVKKYHGGAGLPDGPADIDYGKRKHHLPSEKQRIELFEKHFGQVAEVKAECFQFVLN